MPIIIKMQKIANEPETRRVVRNGDFLRQSCGISAVSWKTIVGVALLVAKRLLLPASCEYLWLSWYGPLLPD